MRTLFQMRSGNVVYFYKKKLETNKNSVPSGVIPPMDGSIVIIENGIIMEEFMIFEKIRDIIVEQMD